MEDRLRGDLVQRGLLCLEVSAALVKAGDNDKHRGGSEHQNREESKVLVVGQLACAVGVQVPCIHLSDEEFAGSHSEKPKRHDRALHRVRRLSV